MSYPIIFETKIVKLSDGRLLHLSLQGCNNDDCGRRRDDFCGKIYTTEEFIQFAESFKVESKPVKESNGFDLQIGSRKCNYYDYGKHLLRMLKRAMTFEELSQKKRFVGIVYKGMVLKENGEEKFLTPKEFEAIECDFLYGRRHGSFTRKTSIFYTEEKMVEALEKNEPMSFYISK